MSENLKTVFSDQEFVNTLFGMENASDVQKALASKGVDLSLDDITKINDLLTRRESNQLTAQEAELLHTGAGELNEDQLENVSGGFAVLNGGVVYDVVSLLPSSKDGYLVMNGKNVIKCW